MTKWVLSELCTCGITSQPCKRHIDNKGGNMINKTENNKLDEVSSHKAAATHVATGIRGLTFTFGTDGVWLNAAAEGLYTSINLSDYAKEGGSITKGLLEWCKQASQEHNQ